MQEKRRLQKLMLEAQLQTGSLKPKKKKMKKKTAHRAGA